MGRKAQPATNPDPSRACEGRDDSEDLDVADLTASYLRQIGCLRLLTREEEVLLAKAVESGIEAENRLRSSPVSARKQARLQNRMQLGEVARQRLIESNLRLVVTIAKHFLGQGLPLEDLVQEGNIGLITAVEKFDYRKGCRFSTYATWWIRQAISRAVIGQARMVRLPVHVAEMLIRSLRVKEQLEQELGRECATDELAEAMGVAEDTLEAALRAFHQPLSLELPVGEDEQGFLGELVEDERAVQPTTALTHKILGSEVRELLNGLGDREREVLVLRFGLENDNALSLTEVGIRLGVTRERVRQIEGKALAKLCHWGEEKGLRDYLRN